jgi:serine/threonine-protein kinase
VHRDIKPENVLLADEAAVVTDFGIAKALHAARTDAPGGTLTQAGASLGTPAYMAPEQISADPSVDHRADIYSFGCVAYEVLTGAAPFSHRQPHQLYAAHISEHPASLKDRRPDCPDDVASLVMQCLEKEPAARPDSARVLLRGFEQTGATTTTTRGARLAARGALKPGRQLVVAAIVGVAIVSAVGAYFAKAPKAPEINALAVLPFQNIGGDTANAYFAEGMSDELTTELARIPDLTLASRNSVAKYKGADAREVGKALNVGGVIDGTVRRAGDQLRLTAQLIDASSGKILWTDTYQQQVRDVFAVQDSITRSIVAALKLKLSGAQAFADVSNNPQGTKDVEAYDLYLQGRYLFAKRGESLRRAVELFDQATRKDPNFARAYAGYAMAGSLVPAYTLTSPDSIVPLAIKAGRRAIEIDPNLADGYLGLANSLLYEFKWSEAEQNFKKAIALEPGNATAHQWYGDLLYVMGRPVDALAPMRRAVQLDPSSPVINHDLGYAAMLAGRYDESDRQLRKARELDSSFPFTPSIMMELKLMEKKYDSVQAWAHVGSLRFNSWFPQMQAYRLTGDTAKARVIQDSIANYIQRPGTDPSGANRAFLYAQTGRPDSAFYWLNHALDRKSAFFFTSGGLPCWPGLRPLHRDARWDLLLKRAKLERCQVGDL